MVVNDSDDGDVVRGMCLLCGWMELSALFVKNTLPPDQPVTRLGKSNISRASSTNSNGFWTRSEVDGFHEFGTSVATG